MNDEQIVKALECCNQENMCDKCPYDLACYDAEYKSIIAKDALDLINRQKAEIERLKEERDEMHRDVITAEKFAWELNEKLKISKSEAIKEFAKFLVDNGIDVVDLTAEYLKKCPGMDE